MYIKPRGQLIGDINPYLSSQLSIIIIITINFKNNKKNVTSLIFHPFYIIEIEKRKEKLPRQYI